MEFFPYNIEENIIEFIDKKWDLVLSFPQSASNAVMVNKLD